MNLRLASLFHDRAVLQRDQPNMEMTLGGCLPLTAGDIAGADFPQIRFFNVPARAHLGPHRTVEGNWQASTPEAAKGFSAAAFSFARRLHRELGVPVGVVSAAWGGSVIQAWTSRSTLALNPDMRGWLDRYEADVWSQERWAAMQSRRCRNRPHGQGPRRATLEHPPQLHRPGLRSRWPHIDDRGPGLLVC